MICIGILRSLCLSLAPPLPSFCESLIVYINSSAWLVFREPQSNGLLSLRKVSCSLSQLRCHLSHFVFVDCNDHIHIFQAVHEAGVIPAQRNIASRLRCAATACLDSRMAGLREHHGRFIILHLGINPMQIWNHDSAKKRLLANNSDILVFNVREWCNYHETFLAHREVFPCKFRLHVLWFCIYFLQCNLADTPTICWRCQWFGWFCGCHYVSTFGYCLRSCCGCLLACIRSLACRGLDFLNVGRRLVIQQSNGTKLEISIWRCALWRFFHIFPVAFVLEVIGSFAPLSAFPVEYVGKISACIQVCMSLGRNLAVDIQQCWLVGLGKPPGITIQTQAYYFLKKCGGDPIMHLCL